jgi:hypothetical protein
MGLIDPSHPKAGNGEGGCSWLISCIPPLFLCAVPETSNKEGLFIMKKAALLIAVVLFFAAFAWHSPAEGQETLLKPWADVLADYPASTVGSNDDPSGMLAGGIVWSRHNLSSYGPVFQASTEEGYLSASDTGDNCVFFGSPPLPAPYEWACKLTGEFGTTQICVFCHTPHHSRQDTDVGPLWNKGNVADTYLAYQAPPGGVDETLGGTPTDVSGSSLTCLGCHDGITTFDSIINRPGSGSNTNGSATNFNWTWSMWALGGGGGDPKQGFDHFRNDNDCAACHPQATGDRLNIGMGQGYAPTYSGATPNGGVSDMSNDHPIGVAYSTDGRASLRPMSTTIVSIDMYNVKSLDAAYATTYGRSDNYWSVFGYINNGAVISDLLRGDNKVECASCHDPHFKNQTNDDPSVVSSYSRTGGSGGGGIGFNLVVERDDPTNEHIDGLFLRRVGGNSNSGVYRTCHLK